MTTPALYAWRARLGLETGGPGWQVQGPPAPVCPAATMALLLIREMRRELDEGLVHKAQSTVQGTSESRRWWDRAAWEAA